MIGFSITLAFALYFAGRATAAKAWRKTAVIPPAHDLLS
jgi:hypothetical protein